MPFYMVFTFAFGKNLNQKIKASNSYPGNDNIISQILQV
jgi:hypothetical protein